MTLRLSLVALAAPAALAAPLFLLACGPSSTDTTSGGSGGAGATGGGGGAGATGGSGGAGGAEACAPSFDEATLHLAAGTTLTPGQERSICLRWTAPEDISISGFQGTLGPALGHHALLMAQESPTAPDGLAPCSEAELMDAPKNGGFSLLAGVSYESDGVAYDFPSAPVQIGLFVPKGTQLIWDAHFLNTGNETKDGCAAIDLQRGKPVVAKLQFRTVLPVEQYGLVVPAHGEVSVSYEEPTGGAYRVAAASSHMHQGGTFFRMSVKETGKVLHESTQWAEPQPTLFDKEKVVLEDGQTLLLECTFENPGDADQKFPAQMCVGGMYLLSCSLPGAC
ncbi:MAG: hypothetical protein R3B70_38140 [Polyangiaceae bacterium]